MSSAEKTGWSGWASFCESVSASMAAPEVLSESTTEEFTNTLASWLRFCSLSSWTTALLPSQHNKQQQRENLLGKAGLQPLPAIVPSLVRSFRGLLRSLSRKIARERSRALSLLSWTIFQRLLGRRSRLLFTTHTEGNFSTADVLLLRCVLRRRFSSFDTPRQTDQWNFSFFHEFFLTLLDNPYASNLDVSL